MVMKEEMKVSAQPQLEPPRMPISRSAQSYFNTWEDKSDIPPQLLCAAQNYQDGKLVRFLFEIIKLH